MIEFLIHRCNSICLSKIQRKCRICPILNKKKKTKLTLNLKILQSVIKYPKILVIIFFV